MTDEVVTRYYREGDEEGIIKLLNSVFNGWPHFDLKCSSLDHWRWKYRRAINKKQCVAVAEDNGEIIGTLSTPYTELKFGEHIVLGRQGTDLAVHPDYRGRGLWKKLNKVLGSALVSYNISSSPIVVEKIKRGKPPLLPGEVLQLVRINDIDLHMQITGSTQPFLKKFGYKGLKTIAQLRKRKPPKLTESVMVRKVDVFDSRVEHFWKKISPYLEFILVKNQEYLNWRYSDPRAGNYNIYIAENENAELVGYMITRINKYTEYHEGYVVDLLVLPGREDVIGLLISEATRLFDDNKVNITKLLAIKGHSLEQIAYEHGFMNFPTKHIIWFGKLEMDNQEHVLNASPDRVQFQYGDTDWI